jgi:hypothetical protein
MQTIQGVLRVLQGLPMARLARRTSNSIFDNARSLLRHPMGPNSKTLSLCERGVVVEKGRQCESKKTFSGGRKSAGAEVPVVRRSVSVNVTDAVTQSITDARRTSNSIFDNARSLLRHPMGPNSKTLSLCSCLFQTRSTPWMVCILTFQLRTE